MLVGILGGGQLGRMLALAGYPLGLRFRFLDPSPEATAGQVGALVCGNYTDEAVLAQFAAGVDVVTYEFENVPVASARLLQQHCPVFPPPAALEVAQDRLSEKHCFRDLGIPTAPFVALEQRSELDGALRQTGMPAVLKTRRSGYDGKGQALIAQPADVEPAWEAVGGVPLILEGFVAFERELSLLAVRSRSGATATYPLVENAHAEGMLRRSLAPAPDVSPALQALAQGYATRVLDLLGYVGVLAIELFQVGETLLANEMAPRVHNSGHWTIEGAETSQFANHLRGVLDLPLGSTAPHGHVAMLNIIGGLPERRMVLEVPGASLHLYDKAPRPGRKLGHVTVCADDAATLQERVAWLQTSLECGSIE
jgi:5-(carboxyamino)imidazole ribonucleotide synthase